MLTSNRDNNLPSLTLPRALIRPSCTNMPALILLAVSLVGCGLEMQKYTWSAALTNTWIDVQGSDKALKGAFIEQAQSSGARLATQEDKATYRLVISHFVIARKVSTLDVFAQITEYELQGLVRFELYDANANVLYQNEVKTSRFYSHNPSSSLLAEYQEETTLKAELQQYLIRRVLDSINAKMTTAPVSAEKNED